jgi:hypothetical protein
MHGYFILVVHLPVRHTLLRHALRSHARCILAPMWHHGHPYHYSPFIHPCIRNHRGVITAEFSPSWGTTILVCELEIVLKIIELLYFEAVMP